MKYVVLVLVCAGCYSPSLRDCTVACEQATDCGGGQICATGFCAAPGIVCADQPADRPDATPVSGDATQSICELGCTNGVCIAGLCVIDCSAPDSCPNDVKCAPNIPCRVVCGDRSCGHHIDCRTAPVCEVVCSGEDSCADEITCNTSECTVTCSGEGSCKRRTKCKDACSCDVSCSGASSCTEAAECPLGEVCRLGRGCSSQLPTCDRCE